MAKKMALGRGLDSLLNTYPIVVDGSSSINEVNIEFIVPNPNQPRTFFDEDALQELASSIRQIGIITPITLKKNSDGTYQIIAGERRYRAAKLAGIDKMPAYVKTTEDEQVLEMALVENIQREDLNAIEIALAYQNLSEQLGLTQEALSDRVGKKRATVANYLRLLKLPAEIQMGLKDRKIEMGHARALISVNDPALQISIYEQIIADNYSVRKTEDLVRSATSVPSVKSVKKEASAFPEEYSLYKEEVDSLFGGKAQLTCDRKGKGKLSISFEDEKELIRFLDVFKACH